jgi:glycosyltransferase involved in cell wall biosynthesis
MSVSTVSVCIPAYNSGSFIEATLRSIMNQTFSNLEIIISDNASTDSTAEIIQELSREDKRIRFIKNESNIGYVKNIMQAVNALHLNTSQSIIPMIYTSLQLSQMSFATSFII